MASIIKLKAFNFETIFSLFLISFLVIVPFHFYILGDGLGYGIQGFTYKYQMTQSGISFIPIIIELNCVANGTISGISGVSILFWVTSFILFFIGTVIFFASGLRFKKSIAFFLIGSGISCVISSIFQYTIYLFGPSGVSILFGIPIIFGNAFLLILKK